MTGITGMTGRWQRRARPLLGTLVEVGVAHGDHTTAIEGAFEAVRHAQACLSRFGETSELARFNALPAAGRIAVHAITIEVLSAAAALRDNSEGLFDISLGSGARAWRVEGSWLIKCTDNVRLDLGGIGKGHAVDLAVLALQQHGCMAGWVNAGGDLRVFGDIDVPLRLRDDGGGVRDFAALRDGAFATSAFGAAHRARLVRPVGSGSISGASANAHAEPGEVGSEGKLAAHVSVAAPSCLWADALTKVVAASGNPRHPLLAHHGAVAWWH